MWTPHSMLPKKKCHGCPTIIAGAPYRMDGNEYCGEHCAYSDRWLKKYSYFTTVEVDGEKYEVQRRKRR